MLTRRGRAVARIVPEAGTEPSRKRPHDAFAELRGTVRLHCDLAGLQCTIRALRTEFSRSLDRRGARLGARGVRSRA